MLRVTPSADQEIRDAFEEYSRLVADSGLSETSQKTYLLHAGNFVRWLNDEFVPGSRT